MAAGSRIPLPVAGTIGNYSRPRRRDPLRVWPLILGLDRSLMTTGQQRRYHAMPVANIDPAVTARKAGPVGIRRPSGTALAVGRPVSFP